MKEINNAYVYRHRRLDTNEIFYVGIGSDSSYKRAFNRVNRSDWWKRLISHTKYSVEIICENILWEEACELEIFLISLYGRKNKKEGNLVNMTDGGEGTIGVIRSEELKKKYGSWNIGRKPSEEHLQKNREANYGEKNAFYGKKHSHETVEHLRKMSTGRIFSESTKELLRSQRTPDKHSASKLVLDTQTGVFYDCAKDAAKAYNIKHSTLKSRLNGTVRNKTNLIYC